MSHRILIVDDSRLTRSIIRSSLVSAGYDVVGEATDGHEGVTLFNKLKPDLVTMDLTMPNSYGMESMQEILSQDPKAKVLVVTALNQKLLQDDAMKLGASAMIAKPFQPDDLVKVVNQMLGVATTGKLSRDQIGDLMEVANVGVGNAAARLSDTINRRCIINIPDVQYLKIDGISKALDMDNSFVVALHIKIMGDIPAIMFVILKRIYAQTIVKYMTKNAIDGSGNDFSFTAQFALKQMGELLTRSFSDSVNQFLKAKSKYAMPEIIVDTWTTTMEKLLSHLGKSEEEQLVIRSLFFDPEKTFEGQFVYILNNESQEKVLNRIRLLLVG